MFVVHAFDLHKLALHSSELVLSLTFEEMPSFKAFGSIKGDWFFRQERSDGWLLRFNEYHPSVRTTQLGM